MSKNLADHSTCCSFCSRGFLVYAWHKLIYKSQEPWHQTLGTELFNMHTHIISFSLLLIDDTSKQLLMLWEGYAGICAYKFQRLDK